MHLCASAGRTGGVVVEEEHGARAADDNVVDAHRDEVDANGAVLLALKGELELGAHAIGARHQEGVACALVCVCVCVCVWS